MRKRLWILLGVTVGLLVLMETTNPPPAAHEQVAYAALGRVWVK